MKAEIKSALVKLAEAREAMEKAKETKTDLEEKFWEIPENAQALEAYQEAKEALAVAEDETRAIITPTYDPQAGKKFDFYTFREKINVTIWDEKQALQWCLSNFTPALTLNKTVFSTAAKAGSIPDELAEVSTELTVAIARDLSELLGDRHALES